MKTTIEWNGFSFRFRVTLARAFIIAGCLLCASRALAQPIPVGGESYSPPTPLDSWSFNDTTNWTSDNGYKPLSFTNITTALFGNDSSLILNTNLPAWLQYNVIEDDGTTNLTVDVGSVAFWFAPAWAGTNNGGTGPGQWGRLIEVGGYTADASFGWWSLYVDDVGANLYFTVQPGDSTTTTYLAAPISWASNYWHCIALTYSATNTALFLDGVLATNGPGVTSWPGTNVLAGGFFIGSDSTGVVQAQGAFDDLYTYNAPLDTNTIYYGIYGLFWPDYYLTPWNMMANILSAPSSPSTNAVTPDVITGAGYLQWVGTNSACVNGTNADQVWITNVTATAAGSGTMNVTFTIAGGEDGYLYDVFATGALAFPITNAVWAWMGQGYHCNTYTIPSLASANAFILLGTPLDSDGDGLTDAYELLVSHTDPHKADSNLDGIPDGWEILLGLNPQTSNLTQPSERANYGYTLADWLNQVSGVKSGAVSLDNEGNVLSVSQ